MWSISGVSLCHGTEPKVILSALLAVIKASILLFPRIVPLILLFMVMPDTGVIV